MYVATYKDTKKGGSMARNNTTYKYEGTPGAGQGTALRDALNTNLVEWSVSALFTRDAGVNERNYFVLSHETGSDEILFYAPNGTSATPATGLHNSFISSIVATTTQLQMLSGHAPNGGFLAALNNVDGTINDPINVEFWDDIVITQSLTQPSLMYPIPYWVTGSTVQDLYFIEDDARSWLCVYNLRQSATSVVSMMLFGEDIYDNTYIQTPADRAKAYGFLFMQSDDSPAPGEMQYQAFNAWNDNDDPIVSLLQNAAAGFAQNPLVYTPVDALPLNSTADIPTAKLPLFFTGAKASGGATDDIIGHMNTLDVKLCPYLDPALKAKLGGTTNHKLIHMQYGFLLPWDDNQATP